MIQACQKTLKNLDTLKIFLLIFFIGCSDQAKTLSPQDRNSTNGPQGPSANLPGSLTQAQNPGVGPGGVTRSAPQGICIDPMTGSHFIIFNQLMPSDNFGIRIFPELALQGTPDTQFLNEIQDFKIAPSTTGFAIEFSAAILGTARANYAGTLELSRRKLIVKKSSTSSEALDSSGSIIINPFTVPYPFVISTALSSLSLPSDMTSNVAIYPTFDLSNTVHWSVWTKNKDSERFWPLYMMQGKLLQVSRLSDEALNGSVSTEGNSLGRSVRVLNSDQSSYLFQNIKCGKVGVLF